MGIWPSRRGNVTGSLPPGLTLPKTTSATAGPAWTPGNHASQDRRRVSDDVLERQRAAAEEHDRERLAGRLDRARSAPPACPAGRACCASWPRRSSHASRRGRARPGRRPARRRRPRRSRRPCRSPPGRRAAPRCWRACSPAANVVAPVLCSLMPSKTVTTSASRPAPHHGPSMSCWLRASGPITAVFRDGIERQDAALVLEQHHRAARGASARRPRRRASASAPRPRLGRNGEYGFSNRPARNLTRRILRTASSIRFMQIRRSREQLLADGRG